MIWLVAGTVLCITALAAAALEILHRALQGAQAELRDQRRLHAQESEEWARERAALITRCMDPSLVATMAPEPRDDTPVERMMRTEDDEIEEDRRLVAEAIDAELAARLG